MPPEDPKAQTMQPTDFRAKILNGAPVRDWMSRRYTPGDDVEGAYAEALRQSAALEEAATSQKSRTG